MLDTIVGQRDSLAMLLTTLRAQDRTNRPLPNMLLLGGPGRGKTTLASAIAEELSVPFVQLHAPSIRDAHGTKERAAFVDLLRSAAGGILFIEEVHALSRTVAEDLYRVIDEGKITVSVPATTTAMAKRYIAATRRNDLPEALREEFRYRGPGMYSVEEPVEVASKEMVTQTEDIGHITVIGATTDEAMLPPAFLSRLSALVVRLRPYKDEEMAQIAIDHAFRCLDTEITAEAALAAAVRSRRTPRRIKQIVERAADWTAARDGLEITVEDVMETTTAMGIDQYGLEEPHRQMLRLLAENDKGLSRTSLAQRMGLPAKNADLYWGDLMELGFVTISTKHEITDKGREAING